MPRSSTMHFAEAVAIASGNLWTHKLRSTLTLLGVIIGVMSVIAVVSLINGANQYVSTKVLFLGADVIGMAKEPSVVTNINDFLAFQKRKRLTREDYEAIRERCKSCTEVGASFRDNVESKSGLNSIRDTDLRAFTPEMASLYDVELTAGRNITDADMQSGASVCVIGSDLVDNLFPDIDPIGKEIRWNGRPCDVIGVGEKQGSALGESHDNWIILPMSTYFHQLGDEKQHSIRITARAASVTHIQDTIDEMRQIMRGRHHLSYDQDDDFSVETADSFLALWKDISGTFFSATIGIACISLVVGGIVIMNIMLVSVTERTREIGVRKALGARRADILLQFLIESLTISGIGGLMGVILGVLAAETVSWVTPMPSAIKLWPMVSGLAVALLVGLFFGTYPASKAAKMDPVEALRAE